jgi:hypothetical protein
MSFKQNNWLFIFDFFCTNEINIYILSCAKVFVGYLGGTCHSVHSALSEISGLSNSGFI